MWFRGGLSLLLGSLMIPAACGQVVDVLSPQQAESGLVTSGELQQTRQWVGALLDKDRGSAPWLNDWIGLSQPFCFQYAGKPSEELLARWPLEEDETKRSDRCTERQLTWRDPATGLQQTWQVKQLSSYPAAEWLLTFLTTGENNTPIFKDIRALDLRLRHSRPGGRYLIHGLHGGRSRADDLMPFSIALPFARWAQKADDVGRGIPFE